jgi:hypothetical protein
METHLEYFLGIVVLVIHGAPGVYLPVSKEYWISTPESSEHFVFQRIRMVLFRHLRQFSRSKPGKIAQPSP